MESRRSLTVGEVQLAARVYGAEISYGRVKIYSSGYSLTPGRISAPNGSIYYTQEASQKPLYSNDISLSLSSVAQAMFIHEMMHIYQFQQGVSVKFGAIVAANDYDFTDKLKNGTPFSRWNIEEQADFAQEMYYRSMGLAGVYPKISNQQLNAVNTGGIVKIDLVKDLKCFPASTLILTPSGSVPISDIKVGDTILAYDPNDTLGRGELTPHKVTRLYRNETTEWIKLTWIENGEPQELITTPGHHFLDEFGAFPTIEDMLENNTTTTLINASGNKITVTASRITYSEQTAHLFEQSASMAATIGNLALKPKLTNSWQTYNFEVATHHTYVANNIRVHNYSGALGAVANTIDSALDRVMGARDGDGSFRDAISDLATSPLHAAGHIVSGALQAAAFVTAGTLGAFSNLSKGNIGGALGSLAAGFGGAVGSLVGGVFSAVGSLGRAIGGGLSSFGGAISSGLSSIGNAVSLIGRALGFNKPLVLDLDGAAAA
jgi:hypothetical protein